MRKQQIRNQKTKAEEEEAINRQKVPTHDHDDSDDSDDSDDKKIKKLSGFIEKCKCEYQQQQQNESANRKAWKTILRGRKFEELSKSLSNEEFHFGEAERWVQLEFGKPSSVLGQVFHNPHQYVTREKRRRFDHFFSKNMHVRVSPLMPTSFKVCQICRSEFLASTDLRIQSPSYATQLFCGHHFHTKCISKLLKRDPRCPVCMKNFEKHREYWRGWFSVFQEQKSQLKSTQRRGQSNRKVHWDPEDASKGNFKMMVV